MLLHADLSGIIYFFHRNLPQQQKKSPPVPPRWRLSSLDRAGKLIDAVLVGEL